MMLLGLESAGTLGGLLVVDGYIIAEEFVQTQQQLQPNYIVVSYT